MGTRPEDVIPPFASNLGELFAVDCILRGCKQGNPRGYLDAWADCASTYNEFVLAHPEITDVGWAIIFQMYGGHDALIDSCARKYQKETKSCCEVSK